MPIWNLFRRRKKIKPVSEKKLTIDIPKIDESYGKIQIPISDNRKIESKLKRLIDSGKGDDIELMKKQLKKLKPRVEEEIMELEDKTLEEIKIESTNPMYYSFI